MPMPFIPMPRCATRRGLRGRRRSFVACAPLPSTQTPPHPATSSFPTPTWSSRASRRCRRASPARSRATPTFAAIGSSTGTRRGARCSSRIAAPASTRRRSSASPAPLAEPEPLTDGGEPVSKARYEPIDGNYIVFERGSGGDEAAQLYRLDLASKQTTRLTEPDERNDMQSWLHRSSQLLYLSVPLDRTARGGTSRGDRADALADGPDAAAGAASPRRAARRRLVGRRGVVGRHDRRADALRVGAGVGGLAARSRDRRQAPGPAGTPEKRRPRHFAAAWKRDGSGLFFVSDRGGEFRELMFHRLGDAKTTAVSRRIPWDIVDVSARCERPPARRARQRRRPQRAALLRPGHLRRAADPAAAGRQRRAMPTSIRACRWLAVTYQSSAAPGTIAVVDPANGAVQRWTTPYAPPGVDTAAFGKQSIVRWKSFDGREISGLLSTPPARFAGRGRCSSTSTAAPRARRSPASSAATTTSSRSSASP